VRDRPAAVRELRRVLSPGGRVAVNVPGTMPRLFEIMDDALARHVGPAAARFVGAVFSLADPGELEELLRSAGFGDVVVTTTTKRLQLPPPADFLWQYVQCTPMGAIVAQAEDARQDDLERDVVAQWQEFVEDGALVVDQPIVTATARS
jgi:hypothetical protein